MAKVSKSILLAYNKCTELAAKWTNILDSFWHKDEKIPKASLADDAITQIIDNLTTTDADKALSANQGKVLKNLIDNISFLDEENPPVFIDSDDADTHKDSLRFTFKDGATVDVSIKDLVDLGAFNSVAKRGDAEYIIDFNTLGGSTISVDLTAWFAAGESPSDFKEVEEIPSYLKVDGISVKTIEGGFSILNTDKITELPLSFFGAKPDLEYIDISFTSGNEITCGPTPFTTADEGKLIAIKDAHHNPNTADGNEYPNSQLGRIVTVTAKITAVTSGVATIDFTCNLTADARAYKYTNNFDAFQQAMNFSDAFGIIKLIAGQQGIYGINPLLGELYTEQNSLLKEPNTPLEIILKNGKLKLCTEDCLEKEVALYRLKQGNVDFMHDGCVFPPDRFTTEAMENRLLLLSTNPSNIYAGNSVRTIKLKNVKYYKEDLDGNDGFFHQIYENSLGGIDEKNKQIVYLEDIDCRCKNGSISSFSQNGNTNTLYHKNINLRRWSNHYEGENGRSDYDNSTIDNMADNGCEWIFDLAATCASGVFSIDDLTSDFSFYDQAIEYMQIRDRVIKIYFESDDYTVGYTINSTNSPKSINVSTLPDGAYGKFKIKYSKDYYGHPVYHHPNQDMIFENVISDKELLWINSSGGVDNPNGNIIKIINSNIDSFSCTNGSIYDYSTNIIIEDSDVAFYELTKLNELKAINSTLRGSAKTKELTKYDDCTNINFRLIVSDTKELTINRLKCSGGAAGEICFQADDINIVLNNPSNAEGNLNKSFSIPIGTGNNNKIIINDYFNGESGYFPSIYFRYPITDLTYYFNNFKSVGYTNLSTSHLFRYINETTPVKFVFSDFYYNSGSKIGGNINPSFTPSHNFNGMISLAKSPFRPNYSYAFVNTISYGFPDYAYKGENTFLKLHGLATNLHIITESNKNFNQINLCLNESTYASNYFRGIALGYNSLFSGEFELKLINGSTLEFTQFLEDFSTYNRLRSNTNLSNVVFKSLKRVDNEIVKFRVDPKQARVIEISSNVTKKYESVKPVRKGVENEKIYLENTNVYWKYIMTFTKKINELFTVASSGLEDVLGGSSEISSDTTINRYVINTGVSDLSILQEKSDGTPYELFSFSLILDGDTELVFTPRNSGVISGGSEDTDKNYILNWWIFEDVTKTYKCYINNITGQIVFDNTTIPFTLKSTNNFKIINGYQITSQEWIRGNDDDEEIVTTAVRTAIFDECRLGYRVFDTDDLTHYTRGYYDWIAGETEVAP